MFGQVQKIIGNVSSSAGYPAKLFPMEVQVAFYRHNPTTRTSLTTAAIGSLLLVGLLGSLGGLAGDLLGGGGLDDTDSNSLPHVPDGEPSKGRVVGEGLHAHGLAGEQLHDGSVSRLDEIGRVLSGLAGTPVNLLKDLGELASNVGGVAVEHWRVAVGHLAGVVQHDDLGGEVGNAGGGLVLGVGGDVASLDVLDRHVLDVEADVVAGDSLGQRLVVHLDGLDLSGEVDRGEGDNHAGLVGGPAGGDDGVESLKEGHAVGLAFLPLNVPALVPGHVGRGLDHVVAVPPGDGHEGNGSWVVANLLDEARHLLLDLLEPGLGVGRLGGVHLVDGDDQLLDTKGVGEEGVLPGLPVLGDASLELSSSRGDDEHTAVSLAGAGDHVLDEVTVPRGVDDGHVVLGGLEFPESNVDGDATLALGLQLVHHPGILEGTLAGLLGLLLELLDPM